MYVVGCGACQVGPVKFCQVVKSQVAKMCEFKVISLATTNYLYNIVSLMQVAQIDPPYIQPVWSLFTSRPSQSFTALIPVYNIPFLHLFKFIMLFEMALT